MGRLVWEDMSSYPSIPWLSQEAPFACDSSSLRSNFRPRLNEEAHEAFLSAFGKRLSELNQHDVVTADSFPVLVFRTQLGTGLIKGDNAVGSTRVWHAHLPYLVSASALLGRLKVAVISGGMRGGAWTEPTLLPRHAKGPWAERGVWMMYR